MCARVYVCVCVCLVEIYGLRITSANKKIIRFLHLTYLFVHIKYASNMAACDDNDANKVTSPVQEKHQRS